MTAWLLYFLFFRKLEDYELKETAERVVKKATTSFPLSPPGGSSISMVSSSSSTKVNTPIPKRSRSEDRIKLQEIEIERLQVDNIRQRQEVKAINFDRCVVWS